MERMRGSMKPLEMTVVVEVKGLTVLGEWNREGGERGEMRSAGREGRGAAANTRRGGGSAYDTLDMGTDVGPGASTTGRRLGGLLGPEMGRSCSIVEYWTFAGGRGSSPVDLTRLRGDRKSISSSLPSLVAPALCLREGVGGMGEERRVFCLEGERGTMLSWEGLECWR